MKPTSSSPLHILVAAFLADFDRRVRSGQRHADSLVTYTSWSRHLGSLHQERCDELTPFQILEWHSELLDAHTSAQAFRAYAFLRLVLGWARRRGLLLTNAASALGITHEPEPGRPLTGPQLDELLHVLDDIEGRRAAARRAGTSRVSRCSSCRAVRLLVITGARLHEVTGCSWEEVHLAERCILRRRTKTGPRAIPLSGEAIELLTLQRVEVQDSRWVFPSTPATRPISDHGRFTASTDWGWPMQPDDKLEPPSTLVTDAAQPEATTFPWPPAVRTPDEMILDALSRLRTERRDAVENWSQKMYVNSFFDCLSLAVMRGVPDEYIFDALAWTTRASTSGLEAFDVLNDNDRAGFVDAMALLRSLGVPLQVVLEIGDIRALTFLAYDFKDRLHDKLRGLLDMRGYSQLYMDRWVHDHNESIEQANRKEATHGAS